MSIYALEHQVRAAKLRLLFFERLYAKGVKTFVYHDVESEIEFLRARLRGLGK